MTSCWMVPKTDDKCWMLLGRMPVDLAYVCVSQRPESEHLARRFVRTYLEFFPSIPHRVTVICNGGPLIPSLAPVFKDTGFKIFVRSNNGWDIGGYLEYSRTTDAKLLICLGESVFFWREGWLDRIVEARRIYGPGVYGFFSSFLVRPHLNTTAFATDPQYLWTYPAVGDRIGRYEFEHGDWSFWRRVEASGGAAKLVTWDGIYPPERWRIPKNILWRGDQSNCLVRCNHTERYQSAPLHVKKDWEAGADGYRPGAGITRRPPAGRVITPNQ